MRSRGNSWSVEENRATVSAYLELLRAELQELHLVKAAINQRVQMATGRSKGAVEYKFQNVSAVLQDLTHPWVEGYKPAANYQDSLRDAVLTQLDDGILRLAFDSITRTDGDLNALRRLNLVPPPELTPTPDDPVTKKAVKVDFVRLDAENRGRGLAGEQLVIRHERERLTSLGLPDLARKVEHVSQTRGDGLGFDILSFTPEGTERYLEVKTTNQGVRWPMVVTRNEVGFSAEVGEKFELVRVFDFSNKTPGCYRVPGDVTETCQLRPATFEATPRAVAVTPE